MKYKSGKIFKIYREVDKKLMGELIINESMCQDLFNRKVFFKFGLKPNEIKIEEKYE